MDIFKKVKKGRIQEILKGLAADFLQSQSTGKSLITITDCHITDNMRSAKIFFTIFPPEHEAEALDFVKRQRQNFRNYVKSHGRLRFIPFIDFEIDKGEKNRQRIDELLNEE